MANIKKTLYQRDTKTLIFTLKRAGVPINLTGYTPYFSAKYSTRDSGYLFNKAGTIVSATDGTCSFALSSLDLASTCNNGVAEVMIENNVSGEQDTLEQFLIDIKEDVKKN